MLRWRCALSYRDREDIESVQTVGLHCGWAGKAEESRVWGGNSLHRCCCFQRQNGELRNANRPDPYRCCFPTRNTVQVNKEEEAAKALWCSVLLVRLCVMPGACSPKSLIFSQFHTLKPLFFCTSFLTHCNMLFKFVISTLDLHDNERWVWRCSQGKTESHEHQNNSRDSSVECLVLCQQTVWDSGFLRSKGGGVREVLLFQELNGPIVKTPLSAHMVDSHSRTASVI